MDDERGNKGPEQSMFEAAGLPGGADDARRPGGRPGPTWQAWLLSIVAAIVLSVAATLLLGGSFRLPGASNAAAGGCGAGSGGHSCPLQGDQEK